MDERAAVEQIVAPLAEVTDPLDAEMIGAVFLSTVLGVDEGERALVEGFLPQAEAVGSPAALGLLTVLGELADPPVGSAAARACERLRERRIEAPGWVDGLMAAAVVRGCVALEEPDGDTVTVAALFERAAVAHAICVLIDPTDCGAAVSIDVFDPGDLRTALDEVHRTARRNGVSLAEVALEPKEFRRRAEIAMDARAVHDNTIARDPGEYPYFATLLQARLRALPLSPEPKPPHGGHEDVDLAGLLAMVESLVDRAPDIRVRGPKPPKLPAKRTKRAGAAPILRLRVDLVGAKPPIWRRLEVPGDMPLRRLHQVLQIAFDWDRAHLYVFETEYGQFGQADPDLEIRSDAKVTLEQVVTSGKLDYVYDFGDDWRHRIVVEKSGPREAGGGYPRCTGGRRAAPPEDCGGIGGYEALLGILADPDDEEHEDWVQWLGLNSAEELDPAAFSPDDVDAALSLLRGRDSG